MSFKQITYLIISISIIHPTFGQGGSLTIENTLAIVKKYHPIVKQSILQNKIAQNEITVAKSIFDPTIQINTEEKSFDNLISVLNAFPLLESEVPLNTFTYFELIPPTSNLTVSDEVLV